MIGDEIFKNNIKKEEKMIIIEGKEIILKRKMSKKEKERIEIILKIEADDLKKEIFKIKENLEKKQTMLVAVNEYILLCNVVEVF
ncbi:hypothetical protein KKC83_00360 [Patescibacteria group bacterium]|nr:hypothetical protein [Candidatus Falkowbacteria bacterium]MBU4015410.1 hypothetical protein [Patescibacteria group bacterium]MBU4025990.1 hypothetical protein [Patescibacteria group bacterium]MBU4072892.1 hypothetical protein [Patescibacteria group bacterium]MBU4102554.1 hypothetical protein [Patescibacteria group bacterium]